MKEYADNHIFKLYLGNSGRQVAGQYVNNQGNTCTQYNDGAYAYKNDSGSSYYNNGSGHGFYTSPSQGTQASNGQQYSTHYNYNQGKDYFDSDLF